MGLWEPFRLTSYFTIRTQSLDIEQFFATCPPNLDTCTGVPACPRTGLGVIPILIKPDVESSFHNSLIILGVTDIKFIIILIVDSQRLELNLDNQMFIKVKQMIQETNNLEHIVFCISSILYSRLPSTYRGHDCSQ